MAFRLVKPGTYRVGRESIASVGLSVFRHALDGRTRRLTSVYPCLDLFEGWAVSPAARASHGNVDLDRQAMGKNRERVRFCFIVVPDAAKTNPGRAAIHCDRTDHAARRDGFQARYGFQTRLLRAKISFCVPACPAEPAISASSRLLRGKISSRSGAADRRGVREHVRGGVARRHGSARDTLRQHGEGGGGNGDSPRGEGMGTVPVGGDGVCPQGVLSPVCPRYRKNSTVPSAATERTQRFASTRTFTLRPSGTSPLTSAAARHAAVSSESDP